MAAHGQQIQDLRKQTSQNVVTLYRQILFIESRMQAYELVFNSFWHRCRAMLSASWLKAQIDQKQMELIKAHDTEMREQMQKPVKAPITIVSAPKKEDILVLA